jgi:hypothetical protein
LVYPVGLIMEKPPSTSSHDSTIPEPGNGTHKAKGVMCCGCYRMMAPDGKPLTALRKGPMGFPEPMGEIGPDDIAWFATNEEADEAAKRFGWRTEDRKGPNHRCPDCIAVENLYKPNPYTEMVENRGAYIDRDELFPRRRF